MDALDKIRDQQKQDMRIYRIEIALARIEGKIEGFAEGLNARLESIEKEIERMEK